MKQPEHLAEESRRRGAWRVAVVGGGISGLSAAAALLKARPDCRVDVFESAPRCGGVLETESSAGFLIERSADSFITTTPWAVELCHEIGLGNQLLETLPENRRAFVVRRGKLYPVPDGFTLMTTRRAMPILRTPLLSPWGKLRLLAEYLVPRRRDLSDESLASFVRRRLGREAFDRLVQPLVAGIYTADAEQLSIQAALPRFVEMERQHGSLIRAALNEAKAPPAASAGSEPGAPGGGRSSPDAGSGARYGMFLTPQGGMSQLVDALLAHIRGLQGSRRGVIRTQAAVTQIARGGAGEATSGGAADSAGGWQVQVGAEPPERYDGLILAASAPRAAAWLRPIDLPLAENLDSIPYAGSVIVAVGFRRDQIGRPLNGAGVVVPATEQRPILACSFTSQKFPGRAPKQHVLLRVFLGGASQPQWLDADDDLIRRTVASELESLLGATGSWSLCRIFRWPRAMPQYHLGHLDRVAAIEQRVNNLPGLALAGNAYRGVGLPDCIRSGQTAADRIAAALAPRPTGP